MDQRRRRDLGAEGPARVARRAGRALAALVVISSGLTLGAPMSRAAAAGAGLRVLYNGEDRTAQVASALPSAPQEPARTYEVNASPSGCSSTNFGAGAWSMATIAGAAGVDPTRVTEIDVQRPASQGGGAIRLLAPDISPATNSAHPGGTDFLDGPAIVSPVNGGATYQFFRPLRAACNEHDTDFNAQDWLQSGPVVIRISGGKALTVTAAVNATTPQPKQTVTFTAAVGNRADGERLTFAWNFGDGTSASGLSPNTVSHSYAAAGTYHPTVTVSGSAGSGGTSAPLTITVGGHATISPGTGHQQAPPPTTRGGAPGPVRDQGGTRSQPSAVGGTSRGPIGDGVTAIDATPGSTPRRGTKGSHPSPVPKTATVHGVLLAGSTAASGALGATTLRSAIQAALGPHAPSTATRVRDAAGWIGGIVGALGVIALFIGGSVSELDPSGRRWRRRRRKAVMA